MDRNDWNRRNIGPDWSNMDTDWLSDVRRSSARERASAANARWIPAERRSAAAEAHRPRHASEEEEETDVAARRPRHASEEEEADVVGRPRHAAEEEETPLQPRHAAQEEEDEELRPRHAAQEDETVLYRRAKAPEEAEARPRRMKEPEDVEARPRRVKVPEEAEARPRRTGTPPAERSRRTGGQPETAARPRRGEGQRVTSSQAPRRTQAGSWEDARSSGRRTVSVDREAYRRSSRSRGRSRGGKPNVPVIVLVAVLVIGMVVAGWQLVSIILTYQRDRSAYNDIAARAISLLAEEDVLTNENGEVVDEAGNVVSAVPISVDWDYLRSVNSDIVGWLYCPGTVINYPVVQTSDNEYYLTHGFTKESNNAGALFADLASVTGVPMSHLIVYGHNMKDNSMFGTYQSYVDESYYKENPIMYYLTPDGSYRVDLVCAHLVEGIMDNFPAYFSDVNEYQAYINSATSRAFWVNYDAINTNYQLLTMSTCTTAQGFADARLLLEGTLVPIQ